MHLHVLWPVYGLLRVSVAQARVTILVLVLVLAVVVEADEKTAGWHLSCAC